VILNEVHNDVMMMYSKDKIHIEQPNNRDNCMKNAPGVSFL